MSDRLPRLPDYLGSCVPLAGDLPLEVRTAMVVLAGSVGGSWRASRTCGDLSRAEVEVPEEGLQAACHSPARDGCLGSNGL